MYYVKRTFHAVGQGAFFTEEFHDDNGLNCCVIYDCGSNTAGQPQKSIDDFMRNHLHVDVLFISHFDSDHINGIKYLIKVHAIDADTYVVLPFRFPKLLVVINQSLRGVIQSLISVNANLIGISQLSGDNAIGNSQGEPKIINDISEIVIGDKITLRDLDSWFYVPFMTHDSTNGKALEEFEKRIVTSGLNVKKLNDTEYVEQNLTLIKTIYIEAHKLSPSKTSTINMNSLLVLSYPSEVFVSESKYNWNRYYRHFERSLHQYRHFKENHLASCLYTGDTGFDNINVFESIMKSINQFCKLPLGLLQIPHHGSIKNYHQGIALWHDKDYLIAFTNYDPRKRVFSNFVKHDLWFHEVPFITVTDDTYTTFAQLIRVE